MTNISAQEHGLDFIVTLTSEDAKFTDKAVAAGIPLIVVAMCRDALRKLVEDEREACAQECLMPVDEIQITDDCSEYVYKDYLDCAEAIRARGQQ
jgi:hypothetical protein